MTNELVSKEADIIATNGIKEITVLMSKKGYVSKTSKTSALFSKSFTKDGKPSFTISGWHGTGGFGDRKTVFELFKTVAYSPETVFSLEEIFPNPVINGKVKTIPGDKQKEIIDKIIAYLKDNA